MLDDANVDVSVDHENFCLDTKASEDQNRKVAKTKSNTRRKIDQQ